MVFLNTFLSLTCGRVKIRRFGQERLLIVLADLNTFLSLACGHVEVAMYDKERSLVVLVTSNYFVIPSQYTC